MRGPTPRRVPLRRHIAWLCLALVACERTHGPAAGSGTPASSAVEEKVVNFYNWMDYIAPDTMANFEKETGIKVRLDTFDNNEVLETKLLTGHTSYDVVLPTENFFDRQLKAGVYRKLDKAEIPNLANADPEILRRMAVHDPGNQYAVPYMFSTTGLGYNVDRVRARLGPEKPTSWALLFDPKNAARLKDCGITITDSPLDVFGSVVIFLGRDPNRHDLADVQAASEVLQRIRPYIRTIDPVPIADLANGDTCLALAWSGDVEMARHRAQQAGTGADIVYFVPREGAFITIDMMAIPADAPHPHNAERWMNYLLRPEVTASITNYIHYPNGNAASLPLVDPTIRSDPSIYPDSATRARLVTASAVPQEYSRAVTREWTRFRTGQ